MSKERRSQTRHETGGELEILSVVDGSVPAQPTAKLLNCSRSGALFRLAAPARGFFRRRSGPTLKEHDSITCVLRLPPAYEPIEMFAEVVRVVPDYPCIGEVEVGLRFFCDVGRGSALDPGDALGRLLEPEKLQAEVTAEHSRRLKANQERRSGRQRRQREEEQPLSCSEAARLVTETSRRLKRVDSGSQRAKREGSDSKRAKRQGSDSKRAKRQGSDSRRSSKRSTRRTAPTRTTDVPTPPRLPRPPQPLPRPPHTTPRHPKPQRIAARSTPLTGRRPFNAHVTAVLEPEETKRNATTVLARIQATRRRSLEDSNLLESDVGAPLVSWTRNGRQASDEPRLVDFGGQLAVRGRATLDGGLAVVTLPKAFARRVRDETLTVHLTPRGPAVLYLAGCQADRLLVQAAHTKLAQVEFDYLVVADRA